MNLSHPILSSSISSLDSTIRSWLENQFLDIEIEIGSDCGQVVFKFARLFPSRRFIGIEIEPSKVVTAEAIREREQLNNVRIVNAEGLSFLKNNIPSGRISRLHVYFPTPLVKYAMTKLLVNQEFFQHAHRVLGPSRHLRLATDVEPYFDKMNKQYDRNQWTPTQWEYIKIDDEEEYVVGSPTEKQYRNETPPRPIFQVELEKN